MSMPTKECDMCLERKTLDNFYLQNGTPRSKCKKCYCKKNNSNPNHLNRVKKYYKENTEVCKERMRNYKLKIKSKVSISI